MRFGSPDELVFAMASGYSRISPTAHYTGFVWHRNGLSHPAFVTFPGKALYRAVHPMNALSKALGGPSLEQMLLERHLIIDHLLTQAIEAGQVGQVLEVGAGLSPRGYRFCRRFAERGLLYVEGDLPAMVEKKKQMLDGVGLRNAQHHVTTLDVTSDRDFDLVYERFFDPEVGTAVVTEGLLPYFAPDAVTSLWRSVAAFLSRFPHGRYLSDIHLETETKGKRTVELFRRVLSLFTRGEVYMFFGDFEQTRVALEEAGFADIALHAPRDFADRLNLEGDQGLIRVVEAFCEEGSRSSDR